MKNIKDIIENFFVEAHNGQIVIDSYDASNYYMPWVFNTEFETRINGNFLHKPIKDNAFVINISNYDAFLEELTNYLNIARKFYESSKKYFELEGENFDKKLIHDLFVNASTIDLENLTKFVSERKEMLKYSNLESVMELGNYVAEEKNKTINCNVSAKVSKLTANFELPLKFEVKFTDTRTNEEFYLPAVTFGINGKTAHVAAVQNLHKEQIGTDKNQLTKILDRYFRKVNKDIDEQSVEANVSPNAVVAMTLFFEYLKLLGIKKVQANDFLPLRYYSTLNSKLQNASYSNQNPDEVIENLNKNQFNMTNKLMYLFLRLESHFDNLDAIYDANSGRMIVDIKNKPFSEKDNIVINISKLFGGYDKELQ